MEREMNRDQDSHQCGSSGQQSYVEGFLKVAHKKYSDSLDAEQNRNIADITKQKQLDIDPCQIKKIQMANMQLNAYNYFKKLNDMDQNVGSPP